MNDMNNKTKHVCIRLTEAEYEQLMKVKAKSKKSVSKLFREQIAFLAEYYKEQWVYCSIY